MSRTRKRCRRNRREAVAALLALALASPPAAEAASTAGTMNVSTTVADSCSVAATTLTFSPRSAANTPSTGEATITVTCSVAGADAAVSHYRDAAWTDAIGTVAYAVTAPSRTVTTDVSLVGLDLGLNALAGVAQLKAAGADFIPYELYQNTTFVTAWTLAAGPAFAATGSPQIFVVCGKVQAGANVPTGAYTDTVGIVVTYV